MKLTRAERAMQIWQVLIAAARNRQILTYKLLAQMIGMGPGTLAQPLGYVMDYCKANGLPPLTALVVGLTSGTPGRGLTTTTDLNRDREAVYAHDWYRMRPVQIDDLKASANDKPRQMRAAASH
jgi:hypothetical protein